MSTIPPSPSRRLSDKLRSALHAACDEGAVKVATSLLELLETQIRHPPRLPAGRERRQVEDLRGPTERIANLLLATADGANRQSSSAH